MKLILLGGGGHCESVIELIQSLSAYRIEGVLDPMYNQGTRKVMEIPVLGDDSRIPEFASQHYGFVITVGQMKSAAIRRKLYQAVKQAKGFLPTLVAESAYVSKHSVLSEGTVVLHGAVVNISSHVGNCCILNTGSILEHGSSVGDFTHISTRAVLNGQARCGSNVFVGSGTVVNEGVNIGDNCIVGSGSLVRKNLPPNSKWAGNPLKKLR